MIESASRRADPTGYETLELFSEAHAFNRWMFETIAPYCNGRVLEIGSGIGNLSAYFLQHYEQVVLSDVKPAYCEVLERTFCDHPALQGVYLLDLGSPGAVENRPELVGQFDTVVALNVVEHIADHEQAIHNGRQLLRAGGQMIILVPAYRWLYNEMDRDLGHFRRYSRKRLARLLSSQGLEVVHTRYFNAAAITGWWISGSLLRRRKLKRGAVRLYNAFVPLMRLVDRLTAFRIGLSVIAVARKAAG